VSQYEQVAEAAPAEKFDEDTVRNRIDDLHVVPLGVNIHPKDACQRGIDHFHDSVHDRGDVRIRWDDRGEAFEHLPGESNIWTSSVFSPRCLVVGDPA
jgi:hypothetical protein